MVEVAGINMPFLDSFGISPLLIYFICFILVFLGVMIIVGFLFWYYIIYNRKIVLYDNIAGQGYKVAFRDRARVIKIGDGGEELLWLMMRREFKSAYNRKMEKGTYWYAVGQDGYHYNVLLGDLDTKMACLDIDPIDRDMRLENVAIRKNAEGRYRRQKWMDKYGIMLMNVLALMIFLFGMWFLIAKMGETATAINQGIQATKEVTEATKQIIASLDNIVTGGSGFKPAPSV